MANVAEAGARGADVRSDCWVQATQGPGVAPSITLRSRVKSLYGESIERLVQETLDTLGAGSVAMTDVAIVIEDSGALPFTIMARIEAALRRLRPDITRSALPELNPAGAYATERERLRRSRLYLPGTTPKFFINAGLHAPDGVILDLEDSVPPAEKDSARLLVRNALRALTFYGAEKMVRINQLSLGLEDVTAVAPHGVHTFLLPKVEDAGQVAAVHRLIEELRQAGQVSSEIFLIPIIESARGIVNAFTIASAAPSVAALAIGLEDYTADIGAQRTRDGRESEWACGQIIVAARAAGVQPLASVYSDVADEEGLHSWARQQCLLGFDGMGCIHPRQIRIIHDAFTPEPAEVEKAQRVVAALQQATAAGHGVVALGGKMVDAPVVARAQRTLALARLAGRA
jgi:citrate lyase subunit beta / citryl-CoA lyase